MAYVSPLRQSPSVYFRTYLISTCRYKKITVERKIEKIDGAEIMRGKLVFIFWILAIVDLNYIYAKLRFLKV